MKKRIFLFATAVVIATTTKATVLTVSNNQNSPGQYTDLEAAIDAASAGDTIYVAGSPNQYNWATIDKQLTMIGAGYNPNNQFGYSTKVGTIYLTDDEVNVTDASGSVIMGFDADFIQVSNADNINNITITRNKSSINMGGASKTHTNWYIRNNIIDYNSSYASIAGSYYASNIYIQNNIILVNTRTAISEFDLISVIISNNIFLCHNTSINAFGNNINGIKVENILITNNIFYGISTGGCDYCTFNNNISYGGSSLTFNYDNNSFSGNIENTDPLFESVALYNFDFTYNYNLQAGSQGENAGTDETDIGVYGGSYPLPSGGDVPWQTSAMPAIPQIIKMNINNAVLPAGGTLQVEIQAESNQ